MKTMLQASRYPPEPRFLSDPRSAAEIFLASIAMLSGSQDRASFAEAMDALSTYLIQCALSALEYHGIS